jgi:hypothetical protein
VRPLRRGGRPGVSGHGQCHQGRLWNADHHLGAGRIDAAPQNVFAATYPDAELIMMGVEEPAALIYAPKRERGSERDTVNALAEALFMQR